MYYSPALSFHLLLRWIYRVQDVSAHFGVVLLSEYSQSERDALVSSGINHISATKCRVNLQTCADQNLSRLQLQQLLIDID